MPNSVTENFILGRNIMLQRRALAQAEEQRRIENERAEKADKLAQQREDRLIKEAELLNKARQAQLNSEIANMRAGIQQQKGEGLLPFSREVEVPAQTLDTSGLTNIPEGQRAAISGQLLSPSAGFGDVKFDIAPELRELLGEDIATETPEKFEQLIEIANRRRNLAAQAESQKASVQAANARIIAQKLENIQRIERENAIRAENRTNKLQDAEVNRKADLEKQKELANFRAGLQRETNKLNVEDTEGIDLLGDAVAAGYADLPGKSSTKMSTLVAANKSIRSNLMSKGVQIPDDFRFIYVPSKKIDEIRKIATIVPLLSRLHQLATTGIERGLFPKSIAKAKLVKTEEDIKNWFGLSEVRQELEPLLGDAAQVVRLQGETGGRFTEGDIERAFFQMFDLGKTSGIVGDRLNDLVNRGIFAVKTETGNLHPLQVEYQFGTLKNLDRFRIGGRGGILPEGNEPVEDESDLDKAIKLGLIQ